MAIIKHIAIKNSNYDAATDYLTFQHDESTNKPILDENGNMIPRAECLIEGINCDPFTFGRECEATNALYGKNQSRSEIKAHHYIISFDPRDRDENGLTLESAQALAMDFARKNFPGHQAIVCAHPDGHNSAGNIHVHIVINSVRKLDATDAEKEKMGFIAERSTDYLAGYKHHVTDQFLAHLKQETMTMCQTHSLYQVDLLSPAKVRITDREYWAKRKGQAKLDSEYDQQILSGDIPDNAPKKEYKTNKEFLRDAIATTLESVSAMCVFPQAEISVDDEKKKRFKIFCEKLYEDYGIEVTESRGRIGYILPDHIKPIRGRMLGSDFEKEHILAVLTVPVINANEKQLIGQEIPIRSEIGATASNAAIAPSNAATPHKYVPSGIRLLTDLETCYKAQQNQYYARKVKITNLQQMAKTMDFIAANNIGSLEELDALLAATKSDVAEKHKALKSTEAEIKTTNLLIKNTGQYLANKDTYRRYVKSKNKAAFREEHRAEITLYEAARKYLKDAGYLQKKDNSQHNNTPVAAKTSTGSSSDSGSIFLPSIKQLKEHKAELRATKNSQYENYSYSRAKYRELQTVHQNVYSILDLEAADMSKVQKTTPSQKQDQSL